MFILKCVVIILHFAFLESVKFRCDYEYTDMGWFKYHEIPATWDEARLRCQLEGGMLASPTTDKMKSIMLEWVCKPEIFTGIAATFSKGDFYTIDGIPLIDIPHEWAQCEPDNKNNDENCTALNYDGKLSDVRCDEPRPYMCFRDHSKVDINFCGTPDLDYRFETQTNKCYKFHTKARIFERAHMICSSEGAHLAIINSDEEAKVISQIYGKYPNEKVVGSPHPDIAIIGFKYWHLNLEWKTIHECVKFRCDYQYIDIGWFKYHEIPETWDEARLRCQLEGAMLASPTTCTMKYIMLEKINPRLNPEPDIFTGIAAIFSKRDYYTIDGIPLSRIPHKWAQYEPDNKNNAENCIALNADGKLSDVRCDEPRPYICYRENSNVDVNVCGTIDPDYHFETQTNKCYKFHKKARIFERAHMICSSEGGYLAIINSEEEGALIGQIFTSYPNNQIVDSLYPDFALIGYQYWHLNSEWITIHGQSLEQAGYAKWGPGRPDNYGNNQYCGSVTRKSLLDDADCDIKYPFICEKDPDYPPVCDNDSKRNHTRFCNDI